RSIAVPGPKSRKTRTLDARYDTGTSTERTYDPVPEMKRVSSDSVHECGTLTFSVDLPLTLTFQPEPNAIASITRLDVGRDSSPASSVRKTPICEPEGSNESGTELPPCGSGSIAPVNGSQRSLRVSLLGPRGKPNSVEPALNIASTVTGRLPVLAR